MIRSEADPLRAVLVCPPGPAYSGVSDLTAQNITQVPDPLRARAQHESLTECLAGAGTRIVEVAEPAGQPNATFARDPALVTPAGYVQLRMGLGARQDEPGWIAQALDAEGLPRIGTIDPPGTVEGGDVFLAGGVALVGRSDRTDSEGTRQLSTILRHLGFDVRVTDVPEPWLHLGSVLSVVAPGRVMATAGVLEPAFLEGFEVLEIPFHGMGATGANVFCVGPDEVIANEADGTEPIDVLESHGVLVHRLDLSEFRKGNGGPTCLTLPLERG